MKRFSFKCVILISLISFCISARQLPIVLVHGILSDEYEMKPSQDYIEKYLPGTYVKSVKIGAGKSTSFFNMYQQVEWLREELEADENLTDGCIIIAHSQGGLVSRYFIERYNNPKVYVYISWGSPQQGVFGTPGKLDNRFIWLNYFERYASKIFYTTFAQKYFSFAGYWHDPYYHNQYLEKCSFLPYINNEKEHGWAETFKANILSLKNMVLVKSPQDDIIEPLESCHFGFYKKGSYSQIEHITETECYNNDWLGLRTLGESGRLHLEFASCTHSNYQEDEQNFVENTLPYLTLEIPA